MVINLWRWSWIFFVFFFVLCGWRAVLPTSGRIETLAKSKTHELRL